MASASPGASVNEMSRRIHPRSGAFGYLNDTFSTASVDELARDLTHSNLTVRMKATHQLAARGGPTTGGLRE